MARRVFYSFHYKPDNWRASKIRNIGAIEGNRPVSDNDWESVTKGGESAIRRWIDDQMSGRGCTVVLIGANTAGRKWINYEIEKSWADKKGVVGIYIHNVDDREGAQSSKGANPFDTVTLPDGRTKLSTVVKAYDPPFLSSKYVYEHISENLEKWVEEAIRIRQSR